MKESTITRNLLKHFNSVQGCKAIKIYSGLFASQAGTPDIVGCYRGQAFFVEVKTKAGKATKLQTARAREWTHVGAYVFRAHSLEAGVAMFEVMQSQVDQGGVDVRDA